MAKKGEKIFIDPEIGEVTFRKSARCSRMSIRVHPLKGVTVSVPYMVPYAAAQLFFSAKRGWIIETVAKQKLNDVHVPSEAEIADLRLRAKNELPPRIAELAERYGFIYNRLSIKHNATNWGSCSTRNNINLNLNIVRLPKALQDYILLHELCHLRHHDHGHAFHLLLEHVCTDNLLKLVDAGDPYALDLARKAAASRAKYPMDHVMSKEIKTYRLL